MKFHVKIKTIFNQFHFVLFNTNSAHYYTPLIKKTCFFEKNFGMVALDE
jgi:hypothetical protein